MLYFDVLPRAEHRIRRDKIVSFIVHVNLVPVKGIHNAVQIIALVELDLYDSLISKCGLVRKQSLCT